ncbi:MAG: hypothetical protein HY353_02135 [Candidatus Omnitrophica bacterium]|nr:hypothetical protein [Candidatus Omnitrophota bacterium]
MGWLKTEQPTVSKKVRVRKAVIPVASPSRARRVGSRQEGTLWQRRMRTLALRLPKGKTRRDRSGAPRKRGG